MIVYNLDVWDTIASNGDKMHLALPNEPFTKMSKYQFEAGLFDGTIIDPIEGAIIQPSKTVQFFPVVNTMHIKYKHNSNDLTSIKKSIRAIMPSDFIIESHWAVLHGIFFAINDVGDAYEEEVWISTSVSDSVDFTYQEITDICSMVAGYTEADTWLDLIDVTYIIRRPL